MLIPKKLIKKYQDIYNKDLSQFTEGDWKKYSAMMREIQYENEQIEEGKKANKNGKRKKIENSNYAS